MNSIRRQIVIGNWKLHGSSIFVSELLHELTTRWTGVHQAEVVVCPAHVYLSQADAELAQSNIALGAQDASPFVEGAYTGDVSAEMLHDVGCHYAIVGHSERRRFYNESDELVAKKFDAVQKAGLIPIVCVGESLQERESGMTLETIGRQLTAVANHCGIDRLSRAVIAYEPLWAVGTGKTALPEQAQEVHAFMRGLLGTQGALTRLVYGGSVKAANAEKLFSQPDIDGALVGGAALKAREFIEICRAAE